MAQPVKKFYTPEEYLGLEETSEQRHEYFNGEIFEMAGGTANHNIITGNLYLAFRQALRGKPCRVFSIDMRLLVNPNGLYTYPDVMVVCGQIEYAPGRNDTVTNPRVIAEVLSSSTAAYDRGEKFWLYQQLATLQAYLLVDQNRMRVEYFQRGEGHKWVLETFVQSVDVLALASLGCEVTLGQIYDTVEFEI